MYIKISNQEKLELGIGNYSCNWGMHIAGLYETEEERDEIIFGFLAKGVVENDLQLYCPCERTEEDFKKQFSKICPDCTHGMHDPEWFSILSARDLYYPTGVFDPIDMNKGLNGFFIESQKNGKKNIRATAEMVWALEAIPGVEHLMAYESRLNYFIPGKPWISICMYNASKFSGSQIVSVLKPHPFTISGGVLMQNPYFMDPDQWLAENAPEFIRK